MSVARWDWDRVAMWTSANSDVVLSSTGMSYDEQTSVVAIFLLHAVDAPERPEGYPEKHQCQRYPASHDDEAGAIGVEFAGDGADLWEPA